MIDYVFDFELEESPSSLPSDMPRFHPQGSSRTRDMVESNLLKAFAADAPSHRAAWQEIEQTGSIYASLRRSSRSSEDGDEADDAAISKLAISMPVQIAISKIRNLPSTAMERKTSLSDRSDVLVPPLRHAMRERGITNTPLGPESETPRGGSPGRRSRIDFSSKKGIRSASVSRERQVMRDYAADPGAVFESLADDDDDEDPHHDVAAGPKGTDAEVRKFVPPHVLARKESREPEVGWRSLVTG